MAEECTHNCSSCSADCSSRENTDFHEAPNAKSAIKHVIGVVSGKGGVGKSLVSAMLAVEMRVAAIMPPSLTRTSLVRQFRRHLVSMFTTPLWRATKPA